ncbi:MAG: hypothetical protein LUD76_05960 [Alistipes sp.]|nr:hypothetical protein [Alistipes sp.]
MEVLKRLAIIFCAVLIAPALVSCDDDDDDDAGSPTVLLTPDKTTLTADGVDAVKFTVTANGETVTGAVINNLTAGSSLSGNSFSTSTPGEYVFTATYGGGTSPEVKVKAAAPETVDPEEVGKIVGTYEVTLGVRIEGATHPTQTNINITAGEEGTVDVELEGFPVMGGAFSVQFVRIEGVGLSETDGDITLYYHGPALVGKDGSVAGYMVTLEGTVSGSGVLSFDLGIDGLATLSAAGEKRNEAVTLEESIVGVWEIYRSVEWIVEDGEVAPWPRLVDDDWGASYGCSRIYNIQPGGGGSYTVIITNPDLDPTDIDETQGLSWVLDGDRLALTFSNYYAFDPREDYVERHTVESVTKARLVITRPSIYHYWDEEGQSQWGDTVRTEYYIRVE